MPKVGDERKERFAQELAKGKNQADAHKAAGFSGSKAAASLMANRPEIKARVKELTESATAKASAKLAISKERVMEELARIGFSDLRKLFDESGGLKPIHELDDDTAAAIGSIEVVTSKPRGGEVEYTHKFKAWDKQSALVNLGKELGMFKQGVDVTGDVTVRNDMGDTELARLLVFQLTKAAKTAT